MKKRVLALLLVMCMVVSLISCNKKNVTVTDVAKEMSELTTGQTEMIVTLDCDIDEETKEEDAEIFNTYFKGAQIKIEGVVESADPIKGEVELYYKKASDSDFAKIVTYLIDGEDYYVNLAELKEFVGSFPEMAAVTSLIQLDKDYLKVSQSELESLTEMSGIEVEESASVEDMMNLEFSKFLSVQIVKFLEENTKDINPAVLSAKSGAMTFSVTNDNGEAFVKALASADIGAFIDSLATESKDNSAISKNVKTITDNKQKIVDGYKETLEDLQKSLAEVKGTYNINFTSEISGSKGSRVAKQEGTFEYKQDKNSVKVGITGSTNEKIEDNRKIELPKETMSIIELMNSCSSFLGGSYEEDDSLDQESYEEDDSLDQEIGLDDLLEESAN